MNLKCECSHVNPHGTIFCESCGKPVDESSKKLLDMRYEGSARRSQTYNKTIIDKIWNFFSSVKVGVWLIVIILVASSLGTILPQEMYIPPIMQASQYYEDQYGWIGAFYYDLGFHNLYSSGWYLILIALLGTSLVIASIDRVVPLYRSLKKQRVTRHETFLNRQRLFELSPENEVKNDSLSKVEKNLKEKRYHIRKENGNLLAEKGRFSRWGPYVNHLGLIIFLIGAMLRFVPGMYVDKVLWLRDGETKQIPDTNGEYYLKNNQFIVELYDQEKDNEVFKETLEKVGNVVKNYQANVTLYQKDGNSIVGEAPDLKKVKDYKIQVNKPLKFGDYAVYQVDYKLNEISKMSFNLTNKETKENYGSITVDMYDPQTKYELKDGYSVEILSYFPDFEFDKEGKPTTKSRIPNNPAFVFKMFTPDKPKGEISFAAIQQTLEPFGDNEYKMTFSGIETKNVTGLTVRKDLTIWIISLGGIIFMIGVIQGSYWNHRRIWIQRLDGNIAVAAHTNKNWHGLKREIQFILADSGLKDPKDQQHQFDNKNLRGETDVNHKL